MQILLKTWGFKLMKTNATYPLFNLRVIVITSRLPLTGCVTEKYIRLKNIDLGYTLPKSLVNKMHFNNIRVYIAGSNLITWSDFKTWDPESAIHAVKTIR